MQQVIMIILDCGGGRIGSRIAQSQTRAINGHVKDSSFKSDRDGNQHASSPVWGNFASENEKRCCFHLSAFSRKEHKLAVILHS